MTELIGRYKGRRFLAFMTTVALLYCGLIFGPAETYSAFTTSVGLVFGAFAAGQSWTDNTKAKNGQAQ